MAAGKAAYETFTIGYGNPGLEQGNKSYAQRAKHYELYWDFYENSIFDSLSGEWATYRTKYGLYRYTRPIYNPTGRLVDFYAGQLYPGLLRLDQSEVGKDIPLAMPFSEKTPQPLKEAIAQLWQWSNFQIWKTVIPKWGAALGNAFVEICDDVEAGKVYFDVVWPSHVVDIELDSRGNVTRYALEYKVTEEQKVGVGVNAIQKFYIYRKEVDKTEIRYFKDRMPFDYTGEGAVVPNPYGFVPAVWFIHNSVGGVFGRPAIHRSLSKINELNSLASQINDRIGKSLDTPAIVASGPQGWKPVFDDAATGKTKRKIATDNEYAQGGANQLGREMLQIFTAAQGTTVHPLVGELDVGKSLLAIDHQLAEISADHPEITFWEKLREMTQVSGVAAKMLSGDVIGRLLDTASTYDRQMEKLFQMGVAIGGLRAGDGSWQNLTNQQQKFQPFGLESYEAGNLDFNILPRPLVNPTDLEQTTIEQSQWTTVGIKQKEGVPFEVAARGLLSEEDMKATLDQKEANKQKAADIAAGAAGQQPPNMQQMMQPDNQNSSGNNTPSNTNNGGNI